jgi:signal transduction histidine kinase
MKAYVKEKRSGLLFGGCNILFINLYFGLICVSPIYTADLLYLDAVILTSGALYLLIDYRRWKQIPKIMEEETQKNQGKMELLLGRQTAEIFLHLKTEQEEEITKLLDERDGLTDYITRWVHEVKLPLSALGLMNERNPDCVLQHEMQDCLERMGQLLHTMLISCKLKNMENDVKFEKISLENAVNEALKNQSFFLIREHFQLKKELENIWVYSDRRWLVYILDQLTANAVKYRREEPALKFCAFQVSLDETVLIIQDNGIGIDAEELAYIFDRGYIGSNLRNGDYRSTGMGLYFVRQIAEKLGIRIQVSSITGTETQFSLHFFNNASYLNL